MQAQQAEEQKRGEVLKAMNELIQTSMADPNGPAYSRVSVYARAAQMIETGRNPARNDDMFNAIMPYFETLMRQYMPQGDGADVLKLVKDPPAAPTPE